MWLQTATQRPPAATTRVKPHWFLRLLKWLSIALLSAVGLQWLILLAKKASFCHLVVAQGKLPSPISVAFGVALKCKASCRTASDCASY